MKQKYCWRPISLGEFPIDGTEVLLCHIDWTGEIMQVSSDYWYIDRVMADWSEYNAIYDLPPTHWAFMPKVMQ